MATVPVPFSASVAGKPVTPTGPVSADAATDDDDDLTLPEGGYTDVMTRLTAALDSGKYQLAAGIAYGYLAATPEEE